MGIAFNIHTPCEISDGMIDDFISGERDKLELWTSGRDALDADGLGWKVVDKWAGEETLKSIIAAAHDIQQKADTLAFISIGGSSFPATSVLEGLTAGFDVPVKTVVVGNGVSARSLASSLKKLNEGEVCVFLNCKNFKTVEPGAHFRIIRSYMESRYGSGAKDRIFVCGSEGEGQLAEFCGKMGYRHFIFPVDSCVRYAALSPSGLLPMAASGIDIGSLVAGAKALAAYYDSVDVGSNPAVRYAIARQLLFRKGYPVELQVHYEPFLSAMGKLWQELFAENEGKNKTGVLPVCCCFSEDLHALGQFIQDGNPICFETMLDLRDNTRQCIFEHPDGVNDGFDYLDGREFTVLADAVYEGALEAHSEGGVPCLEIKCKEYNPFTFGELLYFLMYSAHVSAKLFSAFPFDQPGVEKYKTRMMCALGKI